MVAKPSLAAQKFNFQFASSVSQRASRYCHLTASRPRLAAAPNAMARVNRFDATCAVERAISRGRLAVRSLGDVLFCGGSVKMRPEINRRPCEACLGGCWRRNLRSTFMPHSRDTGEVSVRFTTTQWSEVIEAQQTDPQRAGAALEKLCSRYWYPLYAFVRRRGHEAHDAEDVTQAFFAHLLSKDALNRVERSKGLFRTFLLSSLTNFLNDQRDRQQALKR